uniref:Hemocyanin subunit type 1 n=1 Tax=Pogonognathellus sp. AD-2013 TaxID=1323567 RepID=A0A4D6GK96_9HEXA|nr:hemocyanin subunit type 1 [Pogonognathellus sp. AD-2013]
MSVKMIRSSFILLSLGAVLCVAAATVAPADHDFLVKQNEILKLLNKVHELNFHKDQAKIGQEYDPLAHLDHFKNPRVVQEFVKEYKNGRMLPRGEIFNLFEEEHRREMINIFEVLFFAKDWDTFHHVACYLRDRVNEGQFIYALTVAVLHKPETRGIRLPPAYETYPHLFVTAKVINEAYAAKMRQEPAIIRMNFTGTSRNPEQRVAYFGEDVGMNAHHSVWHKDHPFWWKDAVYGADIDRKGELFWYMHHQLTARFNAERLSNWLTEVQPLQWNKPIVDGFAPQTTYRKGGEFPARPDNFRFQDLKNIRVADLEAYEERIREAISSGFVKTVEGELVSLNNTKGIDILGAIIEASVNSKNPNYYGSIHNLAHIMLSRVTDPQGKFGMPPGCMENFETATRDPAFFRLHKYIDTLFKEHKQYLNPYTREELDVEGVDIKSVEVDDLVTYFEEFDVDLLNALDDTEGLPDVEIKARVQRLNHQPFAFKIHVDSAAEKTVTVRLFIVPKKDWYEREIPIEENRWNVIELDKFTAKLTAGDNTILRKSSESSVSIPDHISTRALRKKVEAALAGTETLQVDKDLRHCGIPDRMLLPKGRENGMKYTLYVVLSDWAEDKVNDLPHNYEYGGSLSYCGAANNKYPDAKPMGFPFDRRITDRKTFQVTNIFNRDVDIVFHPVHV